MNLEKDEFHTLFKEAGFTRKIDLARVLGISYNAINSWGSTKPYPKYVKPFLQMAIKARKYDELMAKKPTQEISALKYAKNP